MLRILTLRCARGLVRTMLATTVVLAATADPGPPGTAGVGAAGVGAAGVGATGVGAGAAGVGAGDPGSGLGAAFGVFGFDGPSLIPLSSLSDGRNGEVFLDFRP